MKGFVYSSALALSSLFIPCLQHSDAEEFITLPKNEVNDENRKSENEPHRFITLNFLQYSGDRALFWQQRLGDEGIKVPYSTFSDAIRDIDDSTLEDLVRLKRLRVDSKQYSTSNVFSEGFIEDWAYVVEKGAALNRLVTLPEYKHRRGHIDLHKFSTGLRNGRIPHELCDYFTDDCSHFSEDVAKKLPIFNSEIGDIRKAIIRGVNRRQHLTRRNKDYSESVDQVIGIDDKPLLALLNEYVNYFDDQSHIDSLYDLLHGKDSEEEKGGIFIYQDGLSLVNVPQRNPNEVLRPIHTESYESSAILYFINSIGAMHSHPLRSKPQNYAGPSEIDLDFLKDSAKWNPRFIHSVVTDMGDRSMNIDVFFQYENEPRIIDLGIYTPRD